MHVRMRPKASIFLLFSLSLPLSTQWHYMQSNTWLWFDVQSNCIPFQWERKFNSHLSPVDTSTKKERMRKKIIYEYVKILHYTDWWCCCDAVNNQMQFACLYWYTLLSIKKVGRAKVWWRKKTCQENSIWFKHTQTIREVCTDNTTTPNRSSCETNWKFFKRKRKWKSNIHKKITTADKMRQFSKVKFSAINDTSNWTVNTTINRMASIFDNDIFYVIHTFVTRFTRGG